MSREPFDPRELADGQTPAEGGGDDDLATVARELEAFAAAESPRPSPAFTEHVMAAVEHEPLPTPPRTFLVALAMLDPRAAWRALGGNVRLAAGASGPGRAGRPRLTLRLQAVALLLAVVLVVAGGGTAAAVGAAAFVQAISNVRPGPTQTLPPTERPSILPTTTPTHHDEPSPGHTETTEPSETAEPSESEHPDAHETPEPSESEHPEASEDDHGSSGGGEHSPQPSGSADPSGDHGGDD